jgi:hypothetical protein
MMERSHSTLAAFVLGTGLLLGLSRPAAADVIDFEDLTLAPGSFYNGSDGAGGFVSQGAFFNNIYDSQFSFWLGWSYSNQTDLMTPGFANQYSCYNPPSGGGDDSPNYGVAFNSQVGDALVLLPDGTKPASVRITNTTYAALSMRDGDMFAKKFGGPDGSDPDFFMLTIYGLDVNASVIGSVDFFLADYRFQDPDRNYIVSSWTTVDLTPLGNATSLAFGMSSSDNGPFGMNTPAYFALDNLVITAAGP